MNLVQTDSRTGYTYSPVTINHMLNWGGFGVCDLCNNPMSHGYLVFILNSCLCPQCFNDWIARANIYPEDLAFQEANQQQWYDYHIKHGHINNN